MRHMAQAFLTQAEIPGLPVIFRGWNNQMQLVAAGGTVPLQTLACLHISDEMDMRLTPPATAGVVFVEYELQVQVCILLDGEGDDITDASDGLVEAIKIRLRSDPNMGQLPSNVFQSAQGKSPQIRVKRGDVQFLNTGVANGTPVQWVAISWNATEEIHA